VFDGNFRTTFEKSVAPVGSGLHKAGVSADAVTAMGPLMAAACAVAIGTGRFPLAVLLLLLSSLPDALDGAVAKAAGRTGRRGAYLDSTSDRLSDALLFAGSAWFLAGGDTPQLAVLPFGVYIAASLISYQRAKAESLGFDAKGGIMERAERLIVFGIGLLFAPIFVPVLWLMLALTSYTVVTRFIKVWKQATAGGDHPMGPKPSSRTRPVRRRRSRTMAEFRVRSQARAEARRRRSKNA